MKLISIILLVFSCTLVYSRGSNEISDPYRISSLTWSPDDTQIAAGLGCGGVKVWDMKNGTQEFLGGYTGIDSVSYNRIEIIQYSPDGRFLLSFGFDNLVKMWDGKTGKQIGVLEDAKVYKHTADTDAVYWDEAKQQVACIGGGFMIIWDIKTRKIVNILKGEQYGHFFGNTIAANAEGTQFVRGSVGTQEGNTREILVWNIKENKMDGLLIGNTSGIYNGLVYSPDGNYVLSCDLDNVLRLWDAVTLNEIYSITFSESMYNLAFSPDGNYFITNFGGTMKLWNIITGEEVFTFLNQNTQRYSSAVFSHDGQFIAMGINHNIRIWDISTGEYKDILADEKEETCEYCQRERATH